MLNKFKYLFILLLLCSCENHKIFLNEIFRINDSISIYGLNKTIITINKKNLNVLNITHHLPDNHPRLCLNFDLLNQNIESITYEEYVKNKMCNVGNAIYFKNNTTVCKTDFFIFNDSESVNNSCIKFVGKEIDSINSSFIKLKYLNINQESESYIKFEGNFFYNYYDYEDSLYVKKVNIKNKIEENVKFNVDYHLKLVFLKEVELKDNEYLSFRFCSKKNKNKYTIRYIDYRFTNFNNNYFNRCVPLYQLTTTFANF